MNVPERKKASNALAYLSFLIPAAIVPKPRSARMAAALPAAEKSIT